MKRQKGMGRQKPASHVTASRGSAVTPLTNMNYEGRSGTSTERYTKRDKQLNDVNYNGEERKTARMKIIESEVTLRSSAHPRCHVFPVHANALHYTTGGATGKGR